MSSDYVLGDRVRELAEREQPLVAYPHEVVLTYMPDERVIGEMTLWCNEQMAIGAVAAHGAVLTYAENGAIVRFRDENHAFAFKLRWAGCVLSTEPVR